MKLLKKKLNNNYKIEQETVNIVRHIFDAQIDHSEDNQVYLAYCNARDIFEYALANNKKVLKKLDYLMAKEDIEKFKETP